jgi:DNA-binding Lrp family transcriptional regulator
MNATLTLDRLDARIIGMLSEDARIAVADLAARLGVARNTAQARLRRLEESGLLTGFIPRVDVAAAGIAVQAYVALALEQGELDGVVEHRRVVPQVLEAHATTGREDLLVRIGTHDVGGLQGVVQALLAIPGVSHSNTTVVLTTPLEYRVQPLLEHLTEDAGYGRSTPAPHVR